MEFLENKGNKKQIMKKKEVSLTDEEYNDLFNSVISSNLTNDIFDGLLNNISESNDSDKENVDPGSFESSNNEKGQDPNNKKDLNKKKIPKFNTLAIGKLNNQTYQKKFVPPIMKLPPPLIAGSNLNTKIDSSASNVSKNKTNKSFKASEVLHAEKVNQKLNEKNTDNSEISRDKLKELKDNNLKKSETCKSSDDNKESNKKEKQRNNHSKKKTMLKEPLRSITYTPRQCSSVPSEVELQNSSDGSSSEKSSSEDQEELSSSKAATWSQRSEACSHFSLSGTLATQLSQPPPSLCQRGRLEWLRQRRDVGVWVQCCNSVCAKWRYLECVKDPVEVPQYWVCSMNNDARFNSCSAAERGPSLSEHIDLIDNKYTAGSVVWARLTGFPWWPAIVDDDPDVEAYYWLNGFSDIPTHYHVVFFDKREVSRAWITPDNLQRFLENGKEPRLRASDSKYSARIEFAKQQAQKALDLDLKLRLQKFGFLAQYKGPIGKKDLATTENKTKSRKRKECDADDPRKNKKEDKIKVTKRKRSQVAKERKNKKSHRKEKCVEKGKAASSQKHQSDDSEEGGGEENGSHSAENCSNASSLNLPESDDFDPFKDDEAEKKGDSEALERVDTNTMLTEGCSNMATVGTDANVDGPTVHLPQDPPEPPKHSAASQPSGATGSHDEAKESASATEDAQLLSPAPEDNQGEAAPSSPPSSPPSPPAGAPRHLPDPEDAVVPTISQEGADGNLSDPFEFEE